MVGSGSVQSIQGSNQASMKPNSVPSHAVFCPDLLLSGDDAILETANFSDKINMNRDNFFFSFFGSLLHDYLFLNPSVVNPVQQFTPLVNIKKLNNTVLDFPPPPTVNPSAISCSRDLHIPLSYPLFTFLSSSALSLKLGIKPSHSVSLMATVMFLVLFLAMAGTSSAAYCICKDGISDAILQKALDYACGAGADCSPILQTGVCYNPNTVKSHCDYAVNSYFQRKGQVLGSCDFAGAAIISNAAPAQTSSCVYQSTPSTTSGTTMAPPTTLTPPTTTTPTPTTTTPTPTTTTPSSTTPPSTYIPGTTPSVFGTGLGPSSFSNMDPNAASAWTPHNHLLPAPILSMTGLAFLLLQF